MSPLELRVPFQNGELAVLDFGGYGSPVLLLHHPAGSAMSWQTLGPVLAERHRVYAMDLPGYAQSTASPRDAFDVADGITAVCEYLELDRPVLVADDCTSYHAVVAAIRSDVVGAILMISGFFLNTAESVHAVLDLFESPEQIDNVVGLAFHTGARVYHPDERAMIVESLLNHRESPWLQEGDTETARRHFERAFRYEGEHMWRAHPTTEELSAYFDVDRSPEWFPQKPLLARAQVPIHMLVSSDGSDAIVASDPKFMEGVPDNVKVYVLAGGFAPRHEIPQDVARLVDIAAGDAARTRSTNSGPTSA